MRLASYRPKDMAPWCLVSFGRSREEGGGEMGDQTGTENITEPKSLEQGGTVCKPVTAIRAGGH